MAAILRVFNLPGLGFWIDEFCTLSEVNGWGLHVSQLPPLGVLTSEPPRYTHRESARPVGAVISGLSREDAHPPLYFLLLRGWMDLLHSESESAVRSLNIVLSLAAIALLYAAVRQQPQYPPAVALWACLLMAVAGPQIEFAQEARSYVPLETLALAAAVALLRIERLGISTWRLAGLALASAAMLLTHYGGVTVIAAMGLYALWNLRGRARWATAAALAGGVIAFAILWGPMLLRQRPIFSTGHQWLIDAGPHRIGRLAVLLLRLPMRLLLEPDDSPLLGGFTWLGPALWALVLASLWRPRLRLWSLLALLSIGAIAASDLKDGIAQLKFIRFTLAAAPGLYVMIAAACRWGRAGWAVPGVALLLAGIALPQAYTPPWKMDFRTPASVIAYRLQPGDGLVFVGPPGDDVGLALTYNGIRHYLPAGEPATTAVLQQPATPAQLAQLAACPHLIVVWLIPDSRTVDAVLPGFQVDDAGQIPYFIDVYHGRIQ